MTGALVLAITWAGTRGFIDRWSVAEWLVAVGTLGLAAATFMLTTRVTRQVKVEAAQLVASSRPFVAPLIGDNGEGYTQDLSRVDLRAGPDVLLQNSGTGPALNVRGALYWTETAGGASSLHPLVLKAGSEEWAKVTRGRRSGHWAYAVGYLRYHDLSGTEWQTHFRFREDGYGNVRAETLAAGESSEYDWGSRVQRRSGMDELPKDVARVLSGPGLWTCVTRTPARRRSARRSCRRGSRFLRYGSFSRGALGLAKGSLGTLPRLAGPGSSHRQ